MICVVERCFLGGDGGSSERMQGRRGMKRAIRMRLRGQGWVVFRCGGRTGDLGFEDGLMIAGWGGESGGRLVDRRSKTSGGTRGFGHDRDGT